MRTLLCIIALLFTAGVTRADSTVWVEPFTEANEQQKPDWINRTLHQALVDELATQGGVRVAAAKTRPADARYVVTAQIQRVNAEIRVTGQVLDTESNKSVGGFKATGTERELFAIQDAIGAQVTKAIAPPAAPTQPAVATNGAQPRIEAPFAPIRFGYEGSDLQQAVKDNRPVRQPPAPVYVEPPVPTLYPVTQQYPNGYNPGYGYNYGYGYPYSGYGYGGGNIIVVNNKGGHGHHGGSPGVGHHGGGGGVIVGNNGVPANNGQAIRAVSGFGGRTPPPGVINTIGR